MRFFEAHIIIFNIYISEEFENGGLDRNVVFVPRERNRRNVGGWYTEPGIEYMPYYQKELKI